MSSGMSWRPTWLGRAGPTTAARLLRDIAVATGARRFAALTSDTTGTDAITATPTDLFEVFTSVRYSAAGADGPLIKRFGDIRCALAELGPMGPFDLIFADPFHSYRESRIALQGVLALTVGRGWLVVHDCLPPLRLAGEAYVDGAWCGSTFAAFRDVATASGRPWFVVDADFGLGVIGPVGHGRGAGTTTPELETCWAAADPTARRELLRTRAADLMHVVKPARVSHVVTGLLAG